MTINHIDQLAEWWENAEEGEAEPGDWIITHGPDDTNPAYIVEQAPRYPLSSKRQPYRILARAPKPKPAWHEADYVIARADGKSRRVWANNRFMKRWEDGVSWSHADDLRDVTPLIGAKVTDAMIDRILDVIDARFDNYPAGIGEDLAVAALGLESE